MSRRLRRSFAVAGLLAVVAAAGCSDGGGSSDAPSTTAEVGQSAVGPSDAPLPIVEQIDDAIAALEALTAAPVDYFEINATAQLINLFVALNDGAVAQPWLYIGGELTSSEGRPASGGTFAGADVQFDPETIFSTLQAELPGVAIESFYIHGDGDGNLLYGVLARSELGGGLDIVLGADGSVKSVDPVS